MAAFAYKLEHDGAPADPPTFTTAVPNFQVTPPWVDASACRIPTKGVASVYD